MNIDDRNSSLGKTALKSWSNGALPILNSSVIHTELFSTYYVPGTILGMGIEAKNEVILVFVLRMFTSNCGKTDSNQKKMHA